MKKIFLVLGFKFYVGGDIISEVGLGLFGWGYRTLGPNHKSLKFLLETRPKSWPFEPLINFVGFLIQKLW